MITFKLTCYKTRIKKNGEVTLFIRVKFSDASARYIPLEISWPYKFFDYKNGVCKSRYKDDPTASAYNILARDEIARLNDIVVDYRLAKKKLTVQTLLDEYHQVASKTDFIAYYKRKLSERLRKGEIVQATYEANYKVIRKLRKWKKVIPFESLSSTWAHEFAEYMKASLCQRIENPANTIWNHQKQIKAYLHLAMKDGYRFTDPYRDYKLKAVKGTWRPIWQQDIAKIVKYYRLTTVDYERKALRRLLLACSTAMRVSDINRFRRDWVEDDYIVFNPYKGRDPSKIIEIPLNKLSRELIADATRENGNLVNIFGGITDGGSLRIIKKVCKTLGIKEKVHHHAGRHSFISIYVAETNDLVGAKEIAGHWSIKQTETYLHLSRARGKENMKKMDQLAG